MVEVTHEVPNLSTAVVKPLHSKVLYYFLIIAYYCKALFLRKCFLHSFSSAQ